MRCHVLFYLNWHMIVHGGQIIAGDRLISSFLLSLMTDNVHNYPHRFLLFNFSLHSINFLFRSFFIYRSFYSF
jgi:hypothetical protein